MLLHLFTIQLLTAMASHVHRMKIIASSHVLCAQSDLLYCIRRLNSRTFILYSVTQNELGTAFLVNSFSSLYMNNYHYTRTFVHTYCIQVFSHAN